MLASGLGLVIEPIARHGSSDHASYRNHVDQAVGRSKLVGADDLGNRAQLRGDEQHGLTAQDKQHYEHQRHAADDNRRHSQGHHTNLGHLAGDHHVSLAEAIGQETGVRSQHQKRQREAGQPQRQRQTLRVHPLLNERGHIGPPLVEHLLADGHHQPAKHVVVQGNEELRGHQCEKAGRIGPAACVFRLPFARTAHRSTPCAIRRASARNATRRRFKTSITAPRRNPSRWGGPRSGGCYKAPRPPSAG